MAPKDKLLFLTNSFLEKKQIGTNIHLLHLAFYISYISVLLISRLNCHYIFQNIEMPYISTDRLRQWSSS